MLYGAFVFVKIWIKGGGARRYPSLCVSFPSFHPGEHKV